LTQVTAQYGLNANLQGLFTASLLIGAMFGSLFGGGYTDYFGRKVAIITVAVFGLIGPIFSAIAPDEISLFISRAVLGISVGLATVACPTYVSENARQENKGALGTLFQLAITFGILVSYFMALPFADMAPQPAYRYMFGIGAAPAVFLLIFGIFMPESEYWKGMKRHEHDALLPNKRGSIQHQAVFTDLFTGSARKSLFIGILMAVAQQLTGINAFMYYAPNIFKSAQLQNTTWPTIGMGFWNFLTTLIATFLVDRLGRRPLILIGTVIMAVACVGLALTYQLVHAALPLGILAIIFLFAFILGFEIGEGPLFWVVCVELFEPEIRGPALSLLNTTVWLFNIMLTFAFLPLSEYLGSAAVFWMFGGIGLVCVIAMYFVLPETKKLNVITEKAILYE